jgi:hypothetical protein
VTYLNDLINHTILLYVDDLINHHVMGWGKFLQPNLEKNFVQCSIEEVIPLMATSRKLVFVFEYSLFHSSSIILLGGNRSRGFLGLDFGASSSSSPGLGFVGSSFLASFLGSSLGFGLADSFD